MIDILKILMHQQWDWLIHFQYRAYYQSEDFDIPLDDIITDKKI